MRNWTGMAKERVQVLAFVSMTMNFGFHKAAEHFDQLNNCPIFEKYLSTWSYILHK
jgi:hypothetical protein